FVKPYMVCEISIPRGSTNQGVDGAKDEIIVGESRQLASNTACTDGAAFPSCFSGLALPRCFRSICKTSEACYASDLVVGCTRRCIPPSHRPFCNAEPEDK